MEKQTSLSCLCFSFLMTIECVIIILAIVASNHSYDDFHVLIGKRKRKSNQVYLVSAFLFFMTIQRLVSIIAMIANIHMLRQS
jgi:hypothetical protein